MKQLSKWLTRHTRDVLLSIRFDIVLIYVSYRAQEAAISERTESRGRSQDGNKCNNTHDELFVLYSAVVYSDVLTLVTVEKSGR